MFWALLLEIQSAITPSILGVRGSSLDSRKLLPITRRKKLVHPKQTVRPGYQLFVDNLPLFHITSKVLHNIPQCCHNNTFYYIHLGSNISLISTLILYINKSNYTSYQICALFMYRKSPYFDVLLVTAGLDVKSSQRGASNGAGYKITYAFFGKLILEK